MRSSQLVLPCSAFFSIKWIMIVSFLLGGCDKNPALLKTAFETDTTQTSIQDSVEVSDTIEVPDTTTVPIDTSHSVSVGGFNVYFGHLHNHSNISDGTGSPSTAYEYARDTAGLDFFGLADHSGSIDSSKWAALKKEADKFNQDNVFVTFWGFEWTSSSYGHVAVIGTDDYCSVYQSETSTFDGLCNWLSTRDAMAFFNHPGRQNSAGTEFDQFAGIVSDKFVGMELWNKDDGFSLYYYNDGYYSDDNEKGYFDEGLARGWKIGAAGSDDNHYGTWGFENQNRLAILASRLTRSELTAAIKSRRFYSTLDNNLLLSFKLDGQEMGSTISSIKPFLQVTAMDEDGESFEELQLIDWNRSVVKTWTLNSSSINIKDSIEVTGNGYFYIIIRQTDGSEAISSPIWVNQ